MLRRARSRARRRSAGCIGMARRPFDTAARGWKKTEYRQGDVLDRGAVDELVQGPTSSSTSPSSSWARHERAARINLKGSRNVFEATVAPSARSASSTPRRWRPTASTRTTRRRSPRTSPRGAPSAHYYSARRPRSSRCWPRSPRGAATSASTSSARASSPGPTRRCCSSSIPYVQLGERVPGAVGGCSTSCPIAASPCCPTPACRSSSSTTTTSPTRCAAAVIGRGTPGVYNLAGAGELTMADLADALG